jgi:AbrB family transcriptional regulator, transcriptional pleiotropic regulator of transition state genes
MEYLRFNTKLICRILSNYEWYEGNAEAPSKHYNCKGFSKRLANLDTEEVKMMKPAGVVRKVDQLGRIVLPKSLRKRYLMNEGDPVEIFVQGDHIILERYRPKCVFCGSMVDVHDFKDRYVCGVCMEEMVGLKL